MENKLKKKEENKSLHQNKELNCSIGKVPLPTFDGSSQSSANTWVQKLDVYFQLNPMVEEDALKMAILHLDGDANEWWFHWLKTLGHDQVKTYGEFIDRVLEMFEAGRDRVLEFSFKELAQLKQVGTPIEYMLEFQRLSVKVANVSMRMLVFMFTEVLYEPLIFFSNPTSPLH